MTITVNKREFRERLDELISLAEGGAEVVVREAGEKGVRLTTAEPPPAKRVAGLHAGRGWMSPDFDAPLPAEYLPSDE